MNPTEPSAFCFRGFWWKPMWKERSESSATCPVAPVRIKHTFPSLTGRCVWETHFLSGSDPQRWGSDWTKSSASGSLSSEVNTHFLVCLLCSGSQVCLFVFVCFLRLWICRSGRWVQLPSVGQTGWVRQPSDSPALPESGRGEWTCLSSSSSAGSYSSCCCYCCCCCSKQWWHISWATTCRLLLRSVCFLPSREMLQGGKGLRALKPRAELSSEPAGDL